MVNRIRQLRRAAETAAAPRAAARREGPAFAEQDEVRALRERIEHLEHLVQGLQDSVHRESSRHEKLIADLQSRVQPAALTKSLSDDARTRGL